MQKAPQATNINVQFNHSKIKYERKHFQEKNLEIEIQFFIPSLKNWKFIEKSFVLRNFFSFYSFFSIKNFFFIKKCIFFFFL